MIGPEPGRSPTRRTFLKQSTAAAAALGLGAGGLAGGAEPPKGKVIDCHAHLIHHSRPDWEREDARLIDAADRLGIDQLCCSILTPTRPASAAGFRECNGWALDATKRYPGRVLAYCYVNPGHQAEALDEIKRRVRDQGFVGVKMYNEFLCTDPIVAPIVELTIELGVPILHHAGHAHYPLPGQPRISDGGHLAELGRRYPEAKLICAHICGGGDWEWSIKAMRHAPPSVYLDTSGSVTDDGVMEMAVRELGVDRLVFGCDMSMTAGVGRIRAAEIDAKAKQKILGGNMAAILKGRKV